MCRSLSAAIQKFQRDLISLAPHLLLLHLLLQQANQLILYTANSISQQQASQQRIYRKNSKPLTSQQPVEPSDEPNDDDPSVEPDDDDDGCLANPKPHKEHVGVNDEGVYYAAHKTHVGVVMWVRKVSLILNLNLMRNMRGWTNWKRFCATYAYCSI